MTPIKLATAAALPLWGALAAGCFFTQSINDEPEARIDVLTPGPHYRESLVTFSALKSSDDDTLSMTWTARSCNRDRTICDTPTIRSVTAAAAGDPFDVRVPAFWSDEATVTETVVVELVAVDPFGAEHRDTQFIDVLNRPPTLSVQRRGAQSASGGFPVGLPVEVIARADDIEGDGITFTWDFRADQTDGWSFVTRQEYDGYVEEVYHVVPDAKGTWTAAITAADPLGASDDDEVEIVAQPDQAPCIEATLPQFQPAGGPAPYVFDRDAGPRRISVLRVADELDVYPEPPASDEYRDRVRFRWYVRTPDTAPAFVELLGHDLPDYLLDPGAYGPGDRLAVRVEVEDRVTRTACDPGLPFCSLREGCYQRVTWEGEVR